MSCTCFPTQKVEIPAIANVGMQIAPIGIASIALPGIAAMQAACDYCEHCSIGECLWRYCGKKSSQPEDPSDLTYGA
jgi:hypothetical protein